MLKGLQIYPPNSGTAEKKKFSNSLLSLFHQRFLAIPGVTMRKVTIGVSGQNFFSTIRRAYILKKQRNKGECLRVFPLPARRQGKGHRQTLPCPAQSNPLKPAGQFVRRSPWAGQPLPGTGFTGVRGSRQVSGGAASARSCPLGGFPLFPFAPHLSGGCVLRPPREKWRGIFFPHSLQIRYKMIWFHQST